MGGGRVFRWAGLILPGWVLHLPAHQQPAPATPPAHPPGSARPDATTTTAPPASTPAPGTTLQAPSPPAGEGGQGGSPATRPAPAAQPDGASGQAKGHKILVLPTGEVVGITLAAAITAALAVARLRQRRRRLPAWPPDKDAAAPLEGGPTTQRLVRFAGEYAKPPDDEPAEAEPRALPPHGPPDPRDPAPARVVVAEQAGEELAVDLAGFGAITISGPRAADAARAALVAVLAAGRPTDTQVLLTGERLLPSAPELPSLRRAATLAEALGLLEAELVGRARMLELYEQPDFASYRAACPDDPLPALLLVTGAPPGREAGRLGAIAEQGRRLGVGVLLAGVEVERAARIGLDEQGRVRVARPAALGEGQLVGARMLTLDTAQAIDLLETLAAARTDQHPAPARQDSTAQPPAQQAPGDTAPQGQAQPARHRLPAQAPAPSSREPSPVGASPAPAGIRNVPAAAPAPAIAPDDQPGGGPAVRPLVTVRLLGAYQIQARDTVVGQGLRVSARELLAYMLVHPDGVTIEQAVEALWPDTALGKERQQFWNALGNLRSVLRQASGHPGKAIVHEHGRYRPEPGLFAVDLWRFQQAIARARDAGDDDAATAALRAAADAYGGGLLDGEPYGWAEPVRRALRDQAVDALSRLAELRERAGDDHGAVVALERAILADPVAEECYRRLMRLHARQRRLDLAQRRYRQLRDRLEELGADPDPQTTRLLGELRRDSTVP
jgi:DNA-binding SARP family transcriptional activator